MVVAAGLCAVSTWIYAARVLIPYQEADAGRHDRPRGNLSDLYPRWLGAKELLLNGRDPYSPEVSREIQAGYYGRVIDPSRPNDPRDEQGFAYPLYVIFFLAPTIRLPFPIVQKSFLILLIVVTCVSVLLWLKVLRWAVPLWLKVELVFLVMGSVAVMQGLKLQQISLLVSGLVAIALTLLIADCQLAAGILLALATIKPQLVAILILWLAIWTLADLHRRYRLAISFLTAMLMLAALSERYLPGWINRFWHAMHEYQRYTHSGSVFKLMVGEYWATFLEVLALAVFLSVCWRERHESASSAMFAFAISLALAITFLVVPTYGPYNEVLLIPAVLLLAKERHRIWSCSLGNRVLLVVTAGLLFWPWALTLALSVLSYILPQDKVERAWAIPLWTLPQIPIAVGALMLVYYYQGRSKKTFAALVGPGSS